MSRRYICCTLRRVRLPRASVYSGFNRPTNGAGGLEGGITNGAPLVVRVAMKPISTLMKPLMSVDSEAPFHY